MPDETKPPQTFQQTAPGGQPPLTGKEAADRATGSTASPPAPPAPNEAGAPPAGSDPGMDSALGADLPADDRQGEMLKLSEEAELGEENVQGKPVQVRTPDGEEIVVGSEEEARGEGEILGDPTGLPYVASRPAYLDAKKG